MNSYQDKKTALYTGSQMRLLDEETIRDHFLSEDVLIERAARSVFEAVFSDFSKEERIGILIGPGNNGADGAAFARMLYLAGFDVRCKLLFPKEKYSDGLLRQLKILESYGYVAEDVSDADVGMVERDLLCCDILVDAVFGIGLKRPVEGRLSEIFEFLNREGKMRKIAMDIPSGLHTDTGEKLGTALKVDQTYTFSQMKRGLILSDSSVTGEVILMDAGIVSTKGSEVQNDPGILYTIFPGEDLFPERILGSHKGTYGKVLSVTGSSEIFGACYLASKSVFAGGAGMVRVITHERNRTPLEILLPEAMISFYEDSCDPSNDIPWCDVILAGCGLSLRDPAPDILDKLLDSGKPIVLDADALNILAERSDLQKKLKEYPSAVVLTPHMKEFAALTGLSVSKIVSDRLRLADQFAKEYNCILVLKDDRTYVTDGKAGHYLNIIGNPGMATAGSGDVLAGMIAAFLAYRGPGREDDFAMTVRAVYMHSAMGDLAAEESSMREMKASDILQMTMRRMESV